MDKRAIPRIQPFIAPCQMVDGERRLGGYLTDISPRGAQVSCDEPPPAAGTAVVLEIRFTAPPRRCRIPALVRWGNPSEQGHACGLTFEELSGEDRSVLENVMERVRRRAAELA